MKSAKLNKQSWFFDVAAAGVGDITTDNGGYETNPEWAAPNFDLFIISDQLGAIMLRYGAISEPITDYNRILIAPINR